MRCSLFALRVSTSVFRIFQTEFVSTFEEVLELSDEGFANTNVWIYNRFHNSGNSSKIACSDEKSRWHFLRNDKWCLSLWSGCLLFSWFLSSYSRRVWFRLALTVKRDEPTWWAVEQGLRQNTASPQIQPSFQHAGRPRLCGHNILGSKIFFLSVRSAGDEIFSLRLVDTRNRARPPLDRPSFEPGFILELSVFADNVRPVPLSNNYW